jgi:hypothetical protein
MTVSELARNAGFGMSASDKPPFLESVLSDFKGLRRHFRVSRIAHIGLNTLYTCYNPSYTHKRAAAPSVDGEGQAAQARPWAPRGRPSFWAIVSATSARLARAPIGPGRAPAPKARIGTCSRV